MSFLLDHLTAILVGTTLLVALLFVQQRGQQNAVEAATRYQSQRLTSGFATTLERDVENIRTRAQTEAAFGGAGGAGLPRYRFTIRRSSDGTYTSQVTFPTLQDPALGDASPILIVGYHVEPTGERALIDGVDRPIYTVTRYEYARGGTVLSQSTLGGVLDFEVSAFTDDGTEIRTSSWVDPTPPRLDVEVATVVERPTREAGDQEMMSFATSRYARTVRVHGATARGGLPPAAGPGDAGIPAFPGDPPPPPPPPPGTTPSTGGGSTGGGGGTSAPPPPPSLPPITGSTAAL